MDFTQTFTMMKERMLTLLQKDAETIFCSAFAHIPAALAITDIETSTFLDVNEYFVEIVGFSRAELIGRSSQDLGIWTSWAERNRLVVELKQQGCLQNTEVSMRTKSGKVLKILSSFELMELGGRNCALGMAVDITKMKENEVKLERAILALESANKAKSEFIANVSHEMRTPLTAIRGFAEIMQHGIADGTSQRVYIDRLLSNVLMLGQLIDDILDFSKSESGKIIPSPAPTAIRATILHLVESFKPLSEKKNILLKADFEAVSDEEFCTDRKLFCQIMNNLLSNALRFTESGAVKVRVKQHSAERLYVEVSDQGCGIKPEDHSRIFEPFIQADSSPSRKYGGTGLGLPIARRMARALGGDLNLKRSTLGIGSTFEVFITDLSKVTQQECRRH